VLGWATGFEAGLDASGATTPGVGTPGACAAVETANVANNDANNDANKTERDAGAPTAQRVTIWLT